MFKKNLLILSLLALSLGCATSESTTTVSSSSSIYPNWYNTSSFSEDSTSFYGYGSSISADSAMAVSRAEKQARVSLGKEIGSIADAIRLNMQEQGSDIVSNTDFIIILREATTLVEENALIIENATTSSEGTFRGFSSVQISKSSLRESLETGFNGHPRYWAAFSGSELYNQRFN